jgi:hypothetical protein
MAPVATWSSEDKVEEAIRRSPQYMPGNLGATFEAMLTPVNLGIMVVTLVVWAGSHFFGVGEIVDVGLLLVGAFAIGASIGDAATKLYEFATTAMDAQCDADLDRAAQAFAAAVIQLGIDAVMAILLRRSALDLQAARGATIGEVARLRNQPGLPSVGADPQPGAIWYRPTTTADVTMRAGQGELTNWFGDITVSAQGTAAEQDLVLFHEQVHSWLSPRFILGRTFRAQLRASAYSRSVLMMYLEEAMAETTAQLRVGNGFQGFLTGVRFPVINNYVSIQSLMSEGAAIGTITVGSQWFSVQLLGENHYDASALVCR